MAGSFACSWDESRQVSSGSQDMRDGDIRFWGQSLSNWGQHCLHGLPLGLEVVVVGGGDMEKVLKNQSRCDLSFWKLLFPTQGLTSHISK